MPARPRAPSRRSEIRRKPVCLPGISAFLCQASGIIIMTDSCRVRPVMRRNSKTLSKTPESEQSGSTTGNSCLIESAEQVAADHALACGHPVDVTLAACVISPLWHMKRLGCARSQLGNVFVENREWTMARWDA